MPLKTYQRDFISFAIDQNALRFGSFKLKSGRISPFFFNAGQFYTGRSLSFLSQCYAATLEDIAVVSSLAESNITTVASNKNDLIKYEMIFGPAYKGIPLVSSTATALYEKYHKEIPYSFNRKEKKDHGEGGDIVGAPLTTGSRVIIIDDVITAGTAIRESLEIIKVHNALAVGIIVALDRQERGTGEKSAIQELEDDYGIPVKPIINLEQIIEYLTENGGYDEHLENLKKYREVYGI
ncbi:5752_t:CDS:1 [Ambispora gerdemannii]|uniref:orotate phosphoribosyltransferase n=1 Tax=Ambispora gerdemannii TaxID=144530 RepID=A0A9N9B9L6_9GLOM|nr:5752_t:CDS:1 [Ambispora gerdemannii]